MDILIKSRSHSSENVKPKSNYSNRPRKNSLTLNPILNCSEIPNRKFSPNKNKTSKNLPVNLSETQMLNRIKRSVTLIQNKNEKKSNSLGSLYQLFSSEYFDHHLLVCYLDRKEEPGIIDTLINILHSRFINESFFYIPQLCTLITTKIYSESLENYILDRCVDQMKFSLKIHWLISSYIENAESKYVKKYDKLIQRIEMTLVNGRRATISSFRLYHSLHIKSEEEVIQYSLDKEYRLNYFDKAIRFYHDLKSMCEKLKDFPKENKTGGPTRNSMLKKSLKGFNENIKELYKFGNSQTNINFYRGYILPFDDSPSTMDDYNSLIVNFLPDHSFCFSTKARVPVKVTVECIRVLECNEWDLKILDEVEDVDNQSNGTQPNTSPFSKASNIVEYSSIDDFFEKIENSEREYNLRKEREIKEIVDSVRYANDHPNENFNPRLSLAQRDSVVNEINNMKTETYMMSEPVGITSPWGQLWSETVKSIRDKSRFRNFETYCVKCFIAKANDDLRQELMTMQLIKRLDDIFKHAEIPLKLRPYEILITSPSSGLIEFLPNTISIDALKKQLPLKWNLNTFFRNYFNNNFEEAQKNFAESLAAYSLVTYLICIRDRHNGNILLDMNGHVIHIDFGFILGISPGNLSFENAPFKLTNEYVEILDGPESNIFHYFKSLILRGLMELRKHVDSFAKIISIMSRGSKMPCFAKGEINQIISSFVERFNSNKNEMEYIKIVDELIYNSLNSWRTVQYDNFQRLTNDIRP